jgi:hypothetical protein
MNSGRSAIEALRGLRTDVLLFIISLFFRCWG